MHDKKKSMTKTIVTASSHDNECEQRPGQSSIVCCIHCEHHIIAAKATLHANVSKEPYQIA
jgi:hypothetical protein